MVTLPNLFALRYDAGVQALITLQEYSPLRSLRALKRSMKNRLGTI
jgi:hypothetical protein